VSSPDRSRAFGIEPIGKLLRQQAVPAAVGILMLSIYGIVDTVFVGRWVGPDGIGAITVVLPIMYLFASIGLAVGVGGSSILSRALGANDMKRAALSFGNMISITLGLSITLAVLSFFFMEEIVTAFGGKGSVKSPALEYFRIIVPGIPFLAWAMMANNVIRAVGHPKVAMVTLIIPAVTNVVLDPILIVWLDLGMSGAAIATTSAYIASAVFTAIFFLRGRSGITLTSSDFIPDGAIVAEASSLGSATLARQGSVSIFYLILNNALYAQGGELGLSVFGIVNRFLLFAIFPILGVTQGCVPIIGYNYGAELWTRVKKIVGLSIRSSTLLAFIIFGVIMLYTPQLVRLFTTDERLIELTIPAMRIVFAMTPVIAINLIGSAYYQSIGKAWPALILTLTRQILFLIPLVLILPSFYGLNGIWVSFPIADMGASAVTFIFLASQLKQLRAKEAQALGS